MLSQVAALFRDEVAAGEVAKQPFSVRKFAWIVMGRENVVDKRFF